MNKSIAVLDIESMFKLEVVWKTILFNCDCHWWDEVVEQVIKAIGCSTERANQITWMIHNLGSCTVYEGDKEACERVADILGSIGLNVKVTQ